MRVGITGANGQLGTDLCGAFRNAGHDVIAWTHADMDVRDADVVHRVVRSSRADLLVNTAAMHNVEACEANASEAAAVNASGARHLAAAAEEAGAAIVQISTDYVFDGDKGSPYVETDEPNPLSVYGKSKLAGERAVAEHARRHFIVRTSALYGRAPCRAKPSGNFVQLMLRLARERGEVKVVTDEIVSPTYTSDLAKQIVVLGESGRYGVYHATSQGETSWYDYAAATFELAGLHPTMRPATTSDFPQKAPRPKYSVLENAALGACGLDVMPHWRTSLERYLAVA